MSFLDIRFPDRISYGATGGSGWNTSVQRVRSGAEQRNQPWANSLGEWEVGHNVRVRVDIDGLISLHMICQGRTHSFRFKDWTDFKHSDNSGSGVVSLISGDTYQLYKRYSYLGQTRDRKITKPVSAIAVAGGGSYSVDYATGIITRNSGAVPTGWSGEFEVPARFDVDLPDIQAIARSGGELVLGWVSIPIKETRV